MDQAARLEELPDLTKEYAYKIGTKGALLGGCALAMALLTSKTFLQGDTEWHVFSASDPFVIPGVLLQLAWWLMFAAGVFMLISSRLPAMRIEFGE